jgi:hypothetical protein
VPLTSLGHTTQPDCAATDTAFGVCLVAIKPLVESCAAPRVLSRGNDTTRGRVFKRQPPEWQRRAHTIEGKELVPTRATCLQLHRPRVQKLRRRPHGRPFSLPIENHSSCEAWVGTQLKARVGLMWMPHRHHRTRLT